MKNITRKCKNCGTKNDIDKSVRTQMKWYCNFTCAAQHGLAKAKADAIKTKKKVHAKQKRDFYDTDMKTRKAAAKTACHAYIKERDLGSDCICCGRPLGKNYDSGHFLESGNNSFLRYHEDNIHSQSVYCNKHKGGDSGDYERNLRLKIGDARVDYLLANKGSGKDSNGNVLKRTADDYKVIESHYKKKLRNLTRRI